MTIPDTSLDSLMGRLAAANVKQGKLPPVNDWHPSRQYRIKIRIDREGRWYYQDSEIKRQSMVKLFASILRRDGDNYFLVTPQEKLLIQVDTMPMVATLLDVSAHPQRLVFTINTGEMVVAGDQHPMVIEQHEDGPLPLVHVRDRLYALIHRNVFYQLVDMAKQEATESGNRLMVESQGQRFEIGQF